VQREIDTSNLTAFGIEDHPAADALRPDPEQVRIASDFLSQYARTTQRWTPRLSSYGVKHRVERWHAARSGSFMSIANGAAILAAINAGFEVSRAMAGSPNAKFKFKLVKVAE